GRPSRHQEYLERALEKNEELRKNLKIGLPDPAIQQEIIMVEAEIRDLEFSKIQINLSKDSRFDQKNKDKMSVKLASDDAHRRMERLMREDAQKAWAEYEKHQEQIVKEERARLSKDYEEKLDTANDGDEETSKYMEADFEARNRNCEIRQRERKVHDRDLEARIEEEGASLKQILQAQLQEI